MIEWLNYLQTVRGNKKVFSEIQYKRSLVVRKLYHMAGAPTLKHLKIMIRQNIIQNFPVTFEYIEIEEMIFSPDVSSLKLITMRQRSKVVWYYFIVIPIELIERNQELILCMDIMFVNQQALFTTIYKDIKFCLLFQSSNRKK